VPEQIAILAAGLGTRLGKPFPKPLTPLRSGSTILRRQITLLREHFGDDSSILVVVGFKLDHVVEAAPDVLFAYNEFFDQTNTSKSLLRALELSRPGGVMWLNGDVVFDPGLLGLVGDAIARDVSFVCVNTATVAEEEVKYTVDETGAIAELSKHVTGGLGEAVGINYVSSSDKEALISALRACDVQDYFERGIELSISESGLRWEAVDITAFPCVEVDFDADLEQANDLMPGS
jgi:choline kinase